MKNKKRIDALLVDRHLAENTAKALRLIMAGRVMADGRVAKHAGTSVPVDAPLEIISSKKYVSRAGEKLEGALNFFKANPEGKICMDIGASTGGFTDCLLQFGAKKVYAVDVGKNLLDQKLKNDPRVIPVEDVNFRYFSSETLKEKVEFVTIDVSFISITKILSNLQNFTSQNADIIAMVKPQFEAPSSYLAKGVLKNDLLRQKVIEEVKTTVLSMNFTLLNEIDSRLKGPKGNIEHFLYLKTKS